MDQATISVLAGLASGYVALVAILLGRNTRRFTIGSRRWIGLTLGAALLQTLVWLLPADAHAAGPLAPLFVGELTRPALGVLLANLVLVFFGVQTLRYLRVRFTRLWLAAVLVWWLVPAVAATQPGFRLGEAGWPGTIGQAGGWPGLWVVAGWMVLGAMLPLIAFAVFYRADLPEVANRALFWAFLIPAVVLGAIVSAMFSAGDAMEMALAGLVMQFGGLMGATYSVWAYRVVDLRRLLRDALAVGWLAAISTGVMLGALLVADELVTAGGARRRLALGGVALGAALIHVPLYALARRLARRLSGRVEPETAQVLRRFSERITAAVELETLVEITQRTLNRVLGVRRGGLLLASYDPDGALHLEPAPGQVEHLTGLRGRLANDSPVLDRLARQHAPLLQYDLDFGRDYRLVDADERAFFQQLRMSAYAPVSVQGRLIGVLCAGAKLSDDPFTARDLELLMALANQVGVALRNARLVADLRRREAEQAELNRQLSATKEQLERLDSVKTDFVTIASHELRTPLTQIRGYSDIMEAMNEEGLLDHDQIASMTGNLRKAADRLESLIEAMLDVSQLDVDAMDLHFATLSIDSVMRGAIEPLMESIKSRKLMVSARGLRALPPIQGDMQRLAQAFRNVVLNAIKYTPDGGRIDITGRLQDDEILIAVRDSGIGIDPKNHELIFEKFFRTHDPGLHSTGTTKFLGAGPGLGLTIARGVIEGHGGRIWVESEREDRQALPGSTFWIALPLSPPAGARRVVAIERERQAVEQRRRTRTSDAVRVPDLPDTAARAGR